MNVSLPFSFMHAARSAKISGVVPSILKPHWSQGASFALRKISFASGTVTSCQVSMVMSLQAIVASMSFDTKHTT